MRRAYALESERGKMKKTHEIMALLKEHHRLMHSRLPLVASENLSSPSVRKAVSSDFINRYLIDYNHTGKEIIENVQGIAENSAKRLFEAKFVDLSPLSGHQTDMVALMAFAHPAGLVFTQNPWKGGHGTDALARGLGLQVNYIPFDDEEYNIDIDRLVRSLRRSKPKLILLDSSVILFPYPLKELEATAKEVESVVVYDASHVLGLIAGKQFQKPLSEGADVVVASTHKTFFGPQGGLILTNSRVKDERIRGASSLLVCNTHLHKIAGIAVALEEFESFGQEYAKQVIRNAQVLGNCLYTKGLKVLAEEKGFTRSHTLVLDAASFGGGLRACEKLDAAGIIASRAALPWDEPAKAPYVSGVRIGTQEVTRLGMKELDMEDISIFIKRALVDDEDPNIVSGDVAEFKEKFRSIAYSFDDGMDGYELISGPLH